MTTEETKQSLVFEAKNVRPFIKDVNDSSKALTDQAKAADVSARELQKQIVELKKADKPNKDLIKSLSLQAQASRLNAAELRAQAAALKEETQAVQRSTKENDARVKTLDKLEKQKSAKIAKETADALKLEAAAANKAAKEQEKLAKEAAKAANKSNADEAKRLSSALKQEAKEASQAAKEQEKLARAAQKAADKAAEQERKFNGTNRGIKDLIVSNGGLIGVATGAALAIGAMGIATIKAADDYNTLQARIDNATKSTGDYMGVSKELNRISKETGTALQSNVDLFQRLKISADAIGASNKDIIRFTESVAKLGVIGGSSPEKIKDATMQLAQMFSQPKIQAEELNSVLDGMPEVARKIEKGLGLLPGQLKSAVLQGKVLSKDVLQGILKQSKEIDKEFAGFNKNLGASAESASNSFSQFAAAMDDAFGITDGLKLALQALGDTFDTLTRAIRENAKSIKLFRLEAQRTMVIAGLQQLNTDGGLSNQSFSGLGAAPVPIRPIAKGKSKQQLIDEANTNFDKQRKLIESGKDSSFVSDKRGAGYGGGDKKKKKKGKSQEQIEKDRVSAIERQFQDRVNQSKAQSQLDIANLGPFSDKEDVLQRQLKAQSDVSGILNQQLIRLNNTTLKTKEGQQALKDAVAKTNIDITENAAATKQAGNELAVFQQAQKEHRLQVKQEAETIRFDSANETIQKNNAARLEDLKKQYDERKISIQEFYDAERDLIRRNANLEANALTFRLGQLEEQKEILTESTEDQNKRLSIENEILAVNEKLKMIRSDEQRDTIEANKKQKKALEEAAEQFGNDLQQSIQSAIVDAFDGEGPLKAMANFARSLKTQVVNFLAQGLAEGLKKSPIVQSLSTMLGNLFNNLSGRVPGSQLQSGAPTYTSVLSPQFTNLSSGNTPTVPGNPSLGGGLLKVAAPIAGAVGSYKLGAAAGAKYGKLKGALVGFGGGAVIGALAGSVFGPVGAAAGAVIGSTIGSIAGLIGGGGAKARQQKRAEYQQNVLQPYLDSLVNGADQNNLQDLIARRTAASRGKPANGSNGTRAKQAAMAQIDELIKARQKSIDDAIKTLNKQNEDLRDSIALADAKPFEKAALERQIAIKQIEFDTKQLLDQFKDSEEARTKILEQESLKRQQLNQQEQQAATDSVKSLQDLLSQRDEIANANVFTRAKSREQLKSEQLAGLDSQIAEMFLTLQGQLSSGITPKDTAGLNQILQQLQRVGGNTNSLEVIIQEANDPTMVREEVTRAFDAFIRKVYGANVA